MKKLILPLLAISCTAITHAQLNVSIVGGVHGASVTSNAAKDPNVVSSIQTNRTAVHAGFIANIPLNYQSRLFFQPGVIYSGKGSKTAQNFDTSKTSTRVLTFAQNVNYIDIPLNLVYKLPLKGNRKFIIGAGPQASLFYNGNVLTSTADIFNQYKESNITDLPIGNGDGKYKVLHFAMNALAGLEFGRTFITLNYSSGITDFYTQNGQSFKHKTIGATIGFELGKPTEQQKKVADQDKDGIPDMQDACPLLAGGAITKGCPDKDGDGIADAEDHCPEIAGTLQNHGCPAQSKNKDGVKDTIVKSPAVTDLAQQKSTPIPDRDKDGVNDEEDQCPDVAGTADNSGCPIATSVLINKVNPKVHILQFQFAETTLSLASVQTLDEVVTAMKAHPELKIRIEGHASLDGQPQHNQNLSQKRANTVKQYLLSKGIAAERITAIGYGSGKPLINNTSENTNAANRRVEIKFYNE